MKIGQEVMTPRGRGFIRLKTYDLKFCRYFYFVDIPKSERMAAITKQKYETLKLWDYEVKEVLS